MVKKRIQAVIKFPRNLLKPLQNYLLREKIRLLKMQKKLSKEDPYEDVRRVDDNAAIDTDVAEQVDHDRVDAMKQEIKKSIINIRKTLTRIRVGNFGLCAKCGQMIDTDRLAIKLTAEYCMKCKRKTEVKKR